MRGKCWWWWWCKSRNEGEAIREDLYWRCEDLGKIQEMRLELGSLDKKSSGSYVQGVGNAG